MIKIVILIGSMITLGFAVWQFLVPWKYRWSSYMPNISKDLDNSIKATNFFFALSLLLLGSLSLIVTSWLWENTLIVKIVLVIMSILWTARVVYQIIKPQGKMIQHVSTIILGTFIITDLLFVIPLFIVFFK
jgi:Kef-type K+ transport system membrane component KefB